MESFDQ